MSQVELRPRDARRDPVPGVDYSRVLAEPGEPPAKHFLGIGLGLAMYLILVPIVSQVIVLVGWLGAGRPLTAALYTTEALAFLHPVGLLATNLALALLTVIALILVRFVHQRDPRWAMSVRPGLRWGYLLCCLAVAAVVLNAVLLLGRGSWHADPQAHVWLWLLIVLLTSPLQAAGEEFFFRGYLLQAFGAMPRDPRTARWFSVLASALVFAFFHGVQNPALFVDRFGFGLLAGWLVLLTGGLEAGIACHVANNIFAFGWAAFSGGIAQARALQSITWGTAASDLLGFALFGVIAWWLSRRVHLATLTGADDDFAHQEVVR